MTITEFLRTRIAEDEAELHPIPVGYCLPGEPPKPGHIFAASHEEGRAIVSARRRVLAECETKRRIVDLVTARGSISGPIPWDRMASANKDILMLLALPYADHPDYRPEWRP